MFIDYKKILSVCARVNHQRNVQSENNGCWWWWVLRCVCTFDWNWYCGIQTKTDDFLHLSRVRFLAFRCVCVCSLCARDVCLFIIRFHWCNSIPKHTYFSMYVFSAFVFNPFDCCCSAVRHSTIFFHFTSVLREFYLQFALMCSRIFIAFVKQIYVILVRSRRGIAKT